MLGRPIAGFGLKAHQEGFEAVQPSVGLFDDRAALVEFFVKVNVHLFIGRSLAGVALDVGLDVALQASRAQGLSI